MHLIEMLLLSAFGEQNGYVKLTAVAANISKGVVHMSF